VVRAAAGDAAGALESVGGARAFLDLAARESAPLGELGPLRRSGLLIALDEMAEGEALEAEWRTAEEMAVIVDGELTDVPGFEAFRKDVLGGGP
jgi:hypothetical protein